MATSSSLLLRTGRNYHYKGTKHMVSQTIIELQLDIGGGSSTRSQIKRHLT
jgi:hypothetical protein